MNVLNVVMVSAESHPFVYGGGLGKVPPALAENLEKSFDFLNVYILFPRSRPSLKEEIGEAEGEFTVEFQDGETQVGVHKKSINGVHFVALSGGKLDWRLYRDGKEEEKNFLFCKTAHQYIKENFLSQGGRERLVVHCHDWHSALTIALLKLDPEISEPVATAYTIHNYFRKSFSPEVLRWFHLPWFLEGEGLIDPITQQVSPDRTALFFAEASNTVSPDYRNTLLRYPEVAWASKGHLRAILNGTDSFEEKIEDLKKRYVEISDMVGEDLTKYPRFHEKEFDGLRGKLKDELKEKVFELARSEKVKQLLKKEYDLDLEFPDWKDGFLFTFVSRLTSQKGVDLAVEAFPRAEEGIKKKTGREARLVILGTGERPDLEKFTSNMLFIEAFSKEIRDLLYLAGDAFLMPSRYEPCGLTPFEAMTCGTPVIVNPVGGLKEIVNRDCGEIMQVEFYEDSNLKIGNRDEAVKALSDAIERMALRLNDNQEREKIIRACMERVNNPRFSWGAVSSGYLTKMYIPALDKVKGQPYRATPL